MKRNEEISILKAIKKLSIEQIQAIILLLNNEIEKRIQKELKKGDKK